MGKSIVACIHLGLKIRGISWKGEGKSLHIFQGELSFVSGNKRKLTLSAIHFVSSMGYFQFGGRLK